MVNEMRVIFQDVLSEWETTCGICGHSGSGNGTKPAACPACGKTW